MFARKKCAVHQGSLLENSPRRLINERDILTRSLYYRRRHFARLNFYFGGFQRSAKADAFRILAIRASHLISEPLVTRNDKRFDQTFGKHSSGPSGLSRSSLNRNSSAVSTNNRRSEMDQRRRETDNRLFCYCLCRKVRWAAYLGALASSISPVYFCF